MDKKLDTYIPLVFIFLVMSLIISSQAIAENNDKILNVLFISSFSKNIPAQIDFEKGINKALGNTDAQDNVFYEFIDASRLNEKYTKEIFAGYLESKYQGIAFDFVVGWSSSAIQFLKLNKNLFMDSNRVYIGAPSKDSNKIWVQFTFARELILNVGHDYRKPTLEILRLEQPKYIYVIATTTNILWIL